MNKQINILLLAFLLLSFLGYGQEKQEFSVLAKQDFRNNRRFLRKNGIDKVISLLSTNYWKYKGQDTSFIDFCFKNNKGFVSNYEKFPNEAEISELSCSPTVRLVKKWNGYFLYYTSMQSHWKSKIIYLSENLLILKYSDGNLEYVNVKL